MCGRFFVPEEDIDDFAGLVNEEEKHLLKKAGEFFPGDYAPVITPDFNQATESERKDVVHLIKWGFPMTNGKSVINARSETVTEKPLFRVPFASRRCIIPTRGFYEWQDQGAGKKRLKYYITLQNKQPMLFAGLYWFFKSKEGQLLPYFVILTTAANKDIESIHDRMPVILSEDQKKHWLYESNTSNLMQYFQPLKEGSLVVSACDS